MNKAILIGRLTRDPEVKYTPSQKVVCTFNMAVDRPFTNQQGEKEADFLPIVLWGKTAELAGNSCKKGHRLMVEGRIQVRTYDNKQGQKVWVTEIIGDRIEFLESKGGNRNQANQGSAPPPQQPPQQDYLSSMGQQVPFDEEVPF